jgi:hypothetical protein
MSPLLLPNLVVVRSQSCMRESGTNEKGKQQPTPNMLGVVFVDMTYIYLRVCFNALTLSNFCNTGLIIF